MKKYFGIRSPWDLVEKDFYRELVNKFREFYFSIPKKRSPVLDITDALKPKDIDNILKVAGFQALGNGFLCTINSLEQAGKFKRADRVRASVRKLSTNLKYTEPDELIDELDSKVRAQTMFV